MLKRISLVPHILAQQMPQLTMCSTRLIRSNNKEDTTTLLDNYIRELETMETCMFYNYLTIMVKTQNTSKNRVFI